MDPEHRNHSFPVVEKQPESSLQSNFQADKVISNHIMQNAPGNSRSVFLFGSIPDTGSFSFSISFSGTMLWQILQKHCAEKGLEKEGSVFVTLRRAKGRHKYNEADVSAFLPPQLPEPHLPTFIGNRAFFICRYGMWIAGIGQVGSRCIC